MRGGVFNFDKYWAYQSMLSLLFKLDIVSVDSNVDVNFDPNPNPLIRAQALFVDPFK